MEQAGHACNLKASCVMNVEEGVSGSGVGVPGRARPQDYLNILVSAEDLFSPVGMVQTVCPPDRGSHIKFVPLTNKRTTRETCVWSGGGGEKKN